MTPGRLARSILGRRGSRFAGNLYRSIFVDLDKVADAIERELPEGARILDVGGGDGAVLTLLLQRRSDIHVTTIDVASSVGEWIDDMHMGRLERVPSTTLAEYFRRDPLPPSVFLLTDVVHHIPRSQRPAFLGDLAGHAFRCDARIVIKDVEPGYFLSRLGEWSDKYVTGDQGVSPVSRAELIAALGDSASTMRWRESDLFCRDRPNYAIAFWHEAKGA